MLIRLHFTFNVAMQDERNSLLLHALYEISISLFQISFISRPRIIDDHPPPWRYLTVNISFKYVQRPLIGAFARPLWKRHRLRQTATN